MQARKYIHTPEIHNLESPRIIVPCLVRWFNPKSVADVGCGLGTFLNVFSDNGVLDILGIDGKWLEKERLFIPLANFREEDLEKKIVVNRKFDLVLCLEVAEHLHEKVAGLFIESLVGMGNIIIFSAAIPNQGGQNHINEQPVQYWMEKFAKHDFVFHDVFREYFWNNASVDWWYKQNMFLVAHKSVDLDAYNIESRANKIKEYVHPELLSVYAEKTKLLRKKLNTIYSGDASGKLYFQLLGKMIRRKILGK